MTKNDYLTEQLKLHVANYMTAITHLYHEITIECKPSHLKALMTNLRDDHLFAFDQLIDVCGVDYLSYGDYDWETDSATSRGFSRGVEHQVEKACVLDKPRFAVVYHLLSTKKNHRLRVKVFIEGKNLIVPSVCELWKVANWFERETYDLYGILFEGHPDLRRLLTDYGFIGHPFRKDFPVSGQVEMRYDAKLEKVIYAPVDIVPRVVVPKVIRHDNRYIGEGSE